MMFLLLLTFSEYVIYPVATKGASFQGDIAIDDVVVTPGTCPQRGSCDFETSTCGYTNVQLNGDDVRHSDWSNKILVFCILLAYIKLPKFITL